jgi:hypothetical protein
MTNDATAGHDALLAYVWEDNGFREAPTDDDKKPFGYNTSLTTNEGSNNAVRLFAPDDPNAKEIIEQNFDGTVAVEFELTNPWFMRGVIAESSSSGTSPTTHTFDGDAMDSVKLFEGNEKTNTYTEIEGVVWQTATFTATEAGTTGVTLSGAYASKNDDGSSFTQPPLEFSRALSGHNADLNRGGTRLGFVQNATVTINRNVDLVDELGTRFAVDYSPKQFNVTLDYTRIVTDDTDRQRAYGDATTLQDTVTNTADFILEWSVGSGADLNTQRLELDDVFPDSESRTGVGDPGADLEDTLNEMSPSARYVAENETATAR